jgi:hypothetical protein
VRSLYRRMVAMRLDWRRREVGLVADNELAARLGVCLLTKPGMAPFCGSSALRAKMTRFGHKPDGNPALRQALT